MNTLTNLILNTDSYKLSHFEQYPTGTENQFSYIESRGTDLNWKNPKTVFFGLQAFIKEYLSKAITHEDIDEAKPLVEAHGFKFNEEGWRYIVHTHNGMLPLKIRAVPEGTVVPLKNILASVEVTDPKCFWLTSYIETAILRAIWYPTTVASNGLRAKQILKKYMDETADCGPQELNFKLHDFGSRGVSSMESAGIGGMAHLVNFMGTDTITGALYAMKYYDSEMPGFSIPASEHSTMTSWGKNKESEAFLNMLLKFGGKDKLVACVSDSYDIWNATENIWGKELRDDVFAMGGTLVVRPDSGDPTKVPLRVIELLMKQFGFQTNSKGYLVLPDCVRVIQGDGITVDTMKKILENMKRAHLSATNIAFGMGAGTLQLVSRDTYKFAMKCSAVKINGKWKDVYKNPVTDKGKVSKKGRMTLVQDRVTKKFRTVRFEDPIEYEEVDLMNVVYFNRPIVEQYVNFDRVREEAAKGLGD